MAITLNGLSHIVTPDLARDLAPELIAMLNHSRPHIRKRAILAVYKLVKKYPEVAAQVRTRMEEKLEDSDPCQFLGPLVKNPCSCPTDPSRCSRNCQCPLRTCKAESKRIHLACATTVPSPDDFLE